MHGKNGVVLRVPLFPEIEAAFLHPAVEIVRANLVREIQQRACGISEIHRRVFVGDAGGRRAHRGRERSGLKRVPDCGALVLHDERAAGRHVIEQASI